MVIVAGSGGPSTSGAAITAGVGVGRAAAATTLGGINVVGVWASGAAGNDVGAGFIGTGDRDQPVGLAGGIPAGAGCVNGSRVSNSGLSEYGIFFEVD